MPITQPFCHINSLHQPLQLNVLDKEKKVNLLQPKHRQMAAHDIRNAYSLQYDPSCLKGAPTQCQTFVKMLTNLVVMVQIQNVDKPVLIQGTMPTADQSGERK